MRRRAASAVPAAQQGGARLPPASGCGLAPHAPPVPAALPLPRLQGYEGRWIGEYVNATVPEMAFGEYWDTCSYTGETAAAAAACLPHFCPRQLAAQPSYAAPALPTSRQPPLPSSPSRPLQTAC